MGRLAVAAMPADVTTWNALRISLQVGGQEHCYRQEN